MRALADPPLSPESVTAQELRAALARGELVAFFQPQIDLVSEVVRGVEALVRWQHPERGLLAPAAFLDAVEEHGLLAPLTEHVLRASLQALKRFRRSGLDLSVAVNVAPETLAAADFPATVARVLEEAGVAGRSLRLEVTESAVMQRGDEAAGEALGRLRSLGLGVSLDDFGTGFSSLARLRALPFDELKIDRSFVADMRAHGDMTMVRMVIDLARHLGLRVVAEGVEEHDDLAVLAGLGCDAAQGYWIARPAPADELEAWLLERQRPVSLRPRPLAGARTGAATRREAPLSATLAERITAELRWAAAEHGCEMAACWVRSEDEDSLQWAAGWAATDGGAQDFLQHSRAMVFVPDIDLPGRAWVADGPVVVTDIAADGGLRRLRSATAAGFGSALALALPSEHGVVGVIELFRRGEQPLEAADAEQLHELAAHAGERIACDLAQQRACALERTLGDLAATVAALRRGASRDAAGAELAAAALRVAEADAVIMWEPADGRRTLVASHQMGWPGALPDLPVAGGASGAAAAFASGTASFVADAPQHPLLHPDLVAMLPVASALYQPVVRGSETVGVLALAWKRPRHRLCPTTRTALDLLADAGALALGQRSEPRFVR